MDLGSGPARAFLEITLPILAPAILSSWLLSFTLWRERAEKRKQASVVVAEAVGVEVH